VSDFEVPIPMGFTWSFPAVVDRWIDGDTPVVHVRRSAVQEEHGVQVRVDGINAIELRDQFGVEAKTFVESLAPVGSSVMLVERNRREKYGRELAQLILPDGRNLGTELMLARASDGVTPLAVPYSP
jgi:endonuclease YncB( thermonuclease family)